MRRKFKIGEKEVKWSAYVTVIKHKLDYPMFNWATHIKAHLLDYWKSGGLFYYYSKDLDIHTLFFQKKDSKGTYQNISIFFGFFKTKDECMECVEDAKLRLIAEEI